MKLFIAILSGAERAGWIHPALAGFLFSLGKNKADASLHFTQLAPVDRARNFAAKCFLESDAEWFLSFDNDAIPPRYFASFIELAVADNLDIAVPRFHAIRVPGEEPSKIFLSWNPASCPIRRQNIDGHGWLELNLCGAHAMLIHRRVFEGMKKPFFHFETDDEGEVLQGEDFNFCGKARAAGFRIFGNVNYCLGHAKTVNLADFAGRDTDFSKNTLPEI